MDGSEKLCQMVKLVNLDEDELGFKRIDVWKVALRDYSCRWPSN